jgi:hypothetical protein
MLSEVLMFGMLSDSQLRDALKSVVTGGPVQTMSRKKNLQLDVGDPVTGSTFLVVMHRLFKSSWCDWLVLFCTLRM